MKPSRTSSATVLLFAAILSLQASKGTADDANWGQVFSPNRIAELLFQFGIQTARGYADITYEDLTIDVLRSSAALHQMEIWPMPDWDGGEDCVISIEKIELTGSAFTSIDNSRGELVLQGLTAPLVCFPADMRLPVVAAGQEKLQVDSLRSTFDYDIPSSSLEAQITARLPGFAAFEVQADFQYLSYWVRDDPSSYPVVYLEGAKMRVENLGGWEALRPVLPPRLTDPERGADALGEILIGFLASEFGITTPYTPAQRKFISSAQSSWGEFLVAPTQITLSFLDGSSEASFIDLAAMDRKETDPFTELQPRLASGWRPVSAMVSAERIDAALNDVGLGRDQKLEVAEALIAGAGVPRNTALGTAILTELAQAGDARAQVVLAELLFERDAAEAYALAIAAAANGSETAVLLLDRLERDLPWRTVRRLQPEVTSPGIEAVDSEKDVALIRDLASSSLRGLGSPRSYGRAMYWALLGQAFGDQESRWIVEEVERRVSAFEDADLGEFLPPIEDATLEFWVAGPLGSPE